MNDDHDEFDDDEDELPQGPSKSQIKRDKLALQALAERLAAMPRAELERLKLSEATWIALDETPRIKDPRARGRHWKRIANLLEREDMEAVRQLMEGAEERERETNARHHALEGWRERLIGEGDPALADFIEQCPAVDRQQLRTLVRAAQRDTERGRPDAPRKLFRFLRETMDAVDS
ncbi:ribosome biogenesis factor YjgA [Thiobaca trueperi]|uniref:Dual-action ribosomal maturation protein DarP n=1 Tax=Thiobaca trueperi TaxID=127458 RepID=A0A4R3MVM3_9GAMM|nr:ribosome biogenesis factor YjgA [Thiobaca trueperi]TCT20590.1 ribosome-associated protein [Thiobaca trueperi]